MRILERANSSAWWPPATTWPAWQPATSPARTDARFAGADMSTKLKLMGVDVASIGDAQGKTPKCRSFRYTDELQADLQEDRGQRRR
jgi:hypothetical protein